MLTENRGISKSVSVQMKDMGGSAAVNSWNDNNVQF